MNLRHLAFCLLSFLLTMLPIRAQATQPAPCTTNILTIAGNQRQFLSHVPTSLPAGKVPAVILLHGAGDNAAYAAQAYGFVEKADREHFILILPDADPTRQAWLGLSPDSPEDPNPDLAFLSTLINQLPQKFPINPRQIYVVGHSSGAIMAYRLAAEMPNKIAAIGIVAGTIGVADEKIHQPESPVPVIAFHGIKDPTIPYNGEENGPVSVSDSIAFWAKADGCDPKAIIESLLNGKVSRKAYQLNGKDEVVLYSLADGNHMWPGGKIMPGKKQIPPQEINATDLMWEFFKDKSSPSKTMPK